MPWVIGDFLVSFFQAVKLESVHPGRTRYLVVVSCTGRQDAEESCLLGIDCHARATVGLVLRVLADTAITLDGDGWVSHLSFPLLFASPHSHRRETLRSCSIIRSAIFPRHYGLACFSDYRLARTLLLFSSYLWFVI